MKTSDPTQQELQALLRQYIEHGKLDGTVIARMFTENTDFEAFQLAASPFCRRDEQTRELGIELAHWLLGQSAEARQEAGATLMWSIAEVGCSRASILALIDVAELMFAGKGMAVDPVSAIDRLYRAKYSAKGDEPVGLAFAAVAKVWAHGKCGLVDHDWAQHYFRVAADLDLVEPAYETGLFFDSPSAGGTRHSPQPDFEAASLYYSVACEAGHSAARTRLGVILTSGVLADADIEVGMELLEESAREGDAMAVEALRILRTS